MKRIKTSELTGVALDWAVAKALGLGYRNDEKYGPMCFRPSSTRGVVAWDSKPLPYSTDWSQGGPIIDREKISVLAPIVRRIGVKRHALPVDCWRAMILSDEDELAIHGRGPTSLIAAMRCFVASKLGDDVDIPKELT